MERAIPSVRFLQFFARLIETAISCGLFRTVGAFSSPKWGLRPLSTGEKRCASSVPAHCLIVIVNRSQRPNEWVMSECDPCHGEIVKGKKRDQRNVEGGSYE